MNRSLALIAILLFAASCSGSASSTTNITSADSGRTIQLRTRDELVVSLDGIPATGFDWTPATAPTPTLEQVRRNWRST